MTRAVLPALQRAEALHPHYGSWLEQAALDAAVIETQTKLALVPERFNRHVPIAGGTWWVEAVGGDSTGDAAA